MDRSLPGSSVHGDSPGKNTGVGCHALLQGSSQPRSPTLQVDSLPSEPLGKPKNTEVGSLSLLQGIFPTQESNRGISNEKDCTSSGRKYEQESKPGRFLGRRHGNPLWYSCLENPHGQRSLAGYSPRGHKESDTTERLSTAQHVVPDRRILRGFSALGS